MDYAATTPIAPEIYRAMEPYFKSEFGNAGSLHSWGQKAIQGLDKARAQAATAIGASFDEIVFTGSATEANNLVLRGVVRSAKLDPSSKSKAKPRIIVSAIEHESVLKTVENIENEAEVVILPVKPTGLVDLGRLKSALSANTVLVSIIYANNEVGTLEPIAEISKIIKDFRQQIAKGAIHAPVAISHLPLLHTDAAQAYQYEPVDVANLGVDFMTLSAHKLYGPKGVGILYVRNMRHVALPLTPIITGGGQEFGLRAGTENVPYIVGAGMALERAKAKRVSAVRHVSKLREKFWQGLTKIFPNAQLNGPDKNTAKAPHILNVYLPGTKAEVVLTALDLQGIAASAGSACSARSLEASPVLKALGYSAERIKGSLRFSFGLPTTTQEIASALAILTKIKNQLK